MKTVEVITAHGHENILARNKNTFEITKDANLTKRGDCIIAVAADKSIKDLSDEFKKILNKKDAKLTIIVQVDDEREVVEAWGNPKLTFNHAADLVVRKSSYICDRTLAIKANKAARDFSRRFVAKLKNSQQKIEITFAAEDIT
ncbi:MAG: DUF371 domain-containing protein [Candidatus Bathyarchaeota archaeon]|nr:DUF371 domain-containing protein [Candidatus Bathyarchaeota archaeon]MDH5495437.1 DUF371 domain-containing protein [Candidatus Bathyarchaeota archaeon]